MTNQMEFSTKREKAVRRCIEWQERLRWAEEEGDKELICYCRSKVEKYLAKIKKIKLAPDYKSNCEPKPVVKPVRRRTFLERKQILEIENEQIKIRKRVARNNCVSRSSLVNVLFY